MLYNILYTDAFGRELLAAHNRYRAAHSAPPLQWSKDAASKAKTWAKRLADTCVLEHGNCDGMGQNIASMISSGGKVDLSGQQAVDNWYNEIKDYNYSSPGFSYNTGHFTQVVWASTTHVGAAKVTKGSNCFVVANYLPPGNMAAEFDRNVKRS